MTRTQLFIEILGTNRYIILCCEFCSTFIKLYEDRWWLMKIKPDIWSGYRFQDPHRNGNLWKGGEWYLRDRLTFCANGSSTSSPVNCSEHLANDTAEGRRENVDSGRGTLFTVFWPETEACSEGLLLINSAIMRYRIMSGNLWIGLPPGSVRRLLIVFAL